MCWTADTNCCYGSGNPAYGHRLIFQHLADRKGADKKYDKKTCAIYLDSFFAYTEYYENPVTVIDKNLLDT